MLSLSIIYTGNKDTTLFDAIELFLIRIALALKQAVYLLPLYSKAVANLVQVFKLLIPEQEIDGGNQHGNIVKRQMVHNHFVISLSYCLEALTL
jgi:hypothetical protein